MVWGGFLNKEGSNYYRLVRSADKSIEFLDKIKKYLNDEDRNHISKTIEIITNHINSLSQGKVDNSE